MLRLEAEWTEALLSKPESGMGYQVVAVEQFGGPPRRAVAYNAELVIYPFETQSWGRGLSYRSLLAEAKSSAGLIRSITVVTEPGHTAVRENGYRSEKSSEANDAPVESTEAGEVFKRFSAYQNDRRVLADGSLSAGTYATTEKDARNVHSGSEAVRRYALPNPVPASWVFTARPHTETKVQHGIVAPAYGQPGGGVEVIFPEGTQPGTTTGPEQIRD